MQNYEKVIAILIENDGLNITDLLAKETESSTYLGHWGEIMFNREECLSTISDTVNYFLQNTDKQLIVFACHKNDIDDIKERIAECDFSSYYI